MNITKEYIDLCKNNKLQGLGKFLKKGDEVSCIADLSFRDTIIEDTMNNPAIIWLPRPDQLDTIICDRLSKMSKNGEDLSYNLGVSFSDGQMSVWQITVENRDYVHEEMDINPLIAKLKLLLSLLESEE